jgi:hypothetical protein
MELMNVHAANACRSTGVPDEDYAAARAIFAGV